MSRNTEKRNVTEGAKKWDLFVRNSPLVYHNSFGVFSPRNASERFAPNVFDSRESEIAERNFEHCGQLKNCCVFQSEDTLKFLRVM